MNGRIIALKMGVCGHPIKRFLIKHGNIIRQSEIMNDNSQEEVNSGYYK